ncbi:hypothetical protein K469DRAFT_661716 [Zopfia rhizophila CBS 207.26]|uniref:Fe2OG dioxygenase domain-containing protein n=1 Tax=Zopfia rhizophila CBS 207.26 TaxID=1314779 RepID=A0A6A6E9H2_9PEZI|nr:hypothetical protein K469DRAFT_661716 [Zopfia rhizophila CBS 207.26]
MSGLTLTPKVLFLALPLAIPAALWSGRVQQLLPAHLQGYFSSTPAAPAPATFRSALDPLPYNCDDHKYTTEIISLDPLVIYINNFTTKREAEELVMLGEADFEDSFISRDGTKHKVTGRTSSSAPLEPDLPLVTCILSRARKFMGTMMQPWEPFSMPQLVRYYAGQKYDLHTDYWTSHQIMNDGSGRRFNRIASFFVFLKDNFTEGETIFPYVDVLDKDRERGGDLEELFKGKVSRGMEKGEQKGVKFKPITGNGIFWVNLDDKGVGDRRVIHGGLPVKDGVKIGMNIWPRKFYGGV